MWSRRLDGLMRATDELLFERKIGLSWSYRQNVMLR